MDKIFSSKHGTRLFFTAIAAILSILLLIRFLIFPLGFLLPSQNELGISFLDKSVTSIFTAVIVGLVLYWMQGHEAKSSIEFTKSQWQINKYLKRARKTTKSWMFDGGLGRYTRATSLPKLSDRAIKLNETIKLKIITLNPFNDELLNDYCNFRLSIESGEEEKWNIVELKSEIFATVLSAIYYKSKNRLLEIDIAVKNHFSLSRMDISTDYAIITRENPKIPSLIFKQDSYLYKHYIEEYNHAYRHSFPLPHYFISQPCKIYIVNVEKCLKDLFPNEEQNYSADFLIKVVDKFQNPKNPF